MKYIKHTFTASVADDSPLAQLYDELCPKEGKRDGRFNAIIMQALTAFLDQAHQEVITDYLRRIETKVDALMIAQVRGLPLPAPPSASKSLTDDLPIWNND